MIKEKGLYNGVEVVMHSICCAAIKVSVESNVESLVSRYETHFDKSRQLSEESAMKEMMIAENDREYFKKNRGLRSQNSIAVLAKNRGLRSLS